MTVKNIETETVSAVMMLLLHVRSWEGVETSSARPSDGFSRNRNALDHDLSQSSSRRGVW